jgi:filamentous hemagglutinin
MLNVGCWTFASLFVLLTASAPTEAGNILRKFGSSSSASATVAGGVGAAAVITSPNVIAAKNMLSRTTTALAAVQQMQNVARGLALGGPNHLAGTIDVGEGLASNGLVADPTKTWQGANLPTQSAAEGQTTVDITQFQKSALLYWTTFNVGKNTTLNFDQSAGGADAGKWIAFNKITDPSGVPSQILGTINTIGPDGTTSSGGQVYIINANGIIFGGSSQVNAHALVASSLPINDNLIQRGLLNNPDGQFLFSALKIPVLTNGQDPQAFDPTTTPGDVPANGVYGDVVVQAGARLTAPPTADSSGGLVALIGPNVTNAGTISTPYGQTVLAAGLQVGLAAHNTNDPTLRGLDVYVGAVPDQNVSASQMGLSPNQTAGTATNAGLDTPNIGAAPTDLSNSTTNPANVNVLGDIEAPYANVTITGKDVEQRGVINSLTSVAYNGRVDLLANYNAFSNGLSFGSGSDPLFLYQSTGAVTLGPGSVTQILPDTTGPTSTTLVAGNVLSSPSFVDIQGQAIHLESDSAGDASAGAIIYAPNAGIMPTLAELKVTQPDRVLPEDGSYTTLGAGVSLTAGSWSLSNVNLTGPPVAVKGAKGQLIAVTSPASVSQISLDAGATIDVSGSQNVNASVAENIVPVQLAGAQLANSPLQRGGPFYRQTINVDIRQTGNYNGQEWAGTPLADTTGFINLIQRSVGELTTSGGTVALNAGDKVVMQSGSTINVSGGSIQYAGGIVSTTKVVTDGHLLDISKATPDLIYSGIYTGTSTTMDAKWGIGQTFANPLFGGSGKYEQGYIQGGNAGSLTIAAPAMTLDGNFLGNTTPGLYQRTPLSLINSNTEFGATTILHTMQSVLGVPMAGALSLVFQGEAAASGTGSAIAPVTENDIYFQAPNNQASVGSSNPVVLSTSLINANADDFAGFGSLTIINPTGKIEVQADMTAPAGGTLDFTGKNITIDTNVSMSAPAGILRFVVDDASPFSAPDLTKLSSLNTLDGAGQFTLGTNASLSTAGLIVDDRATSATPGTLPLLTDGGTISINAYRIDLSAGRAVDVSGGVEMSAANKLTYGKGGTLNINAVDPLYTALGLLPDTPASYRGQLLLGTPLKGYSGKANNGGTLSITAPFVQIGGDQLLNSDSLSTVGRTLWLNRTDANGNLLQPDFFNQGGFSNFNLSGLGDFALDSSNHIIPYASMPGLVIAPDTVIDPQVSNWRALTPVGGLTLQPVLLPAEQRTTAANLTFNSLGLNTNFAQAYINNPEGLRGDLVVYSGASIETDPHGSSTGSVTLTGNTVTMLGSIIAPGGRISVTSAFPLDETTVPLFAQQSVPTVDLGPGSVLDASGTTVLTPDASGHNLRTGNVLPGGSISIAGNIVAETGAVLAVNGATDQLDFPQVLTGTNMAQSGNISGSAYVRAREDSNGGTISLTGIDELFAGATLSGFAGGSNLPGGSMAQGGGITVLSSIYTNGASISPTVPTLFLTPGTMPFHVAGQTVIGNPVTDANGNAIPGAGYFSADRFNNRGFSSLTLKGVVQFSGPVELDASNSLAVADGGILQADPAVTASSLVLNAPYVALGESFVLPVQPSNAQRVFSLGSTTLSVLPTYGLSGLTVNASDLIDIGNLSLQNIGAANFNVPAGDIRGDGTLDVAGAINLTAGQVYVPTAVNFTVAAYDNPNVSASGSVTINPGSVTRPLPLSAGGTLNIYAANITQGGVLRAPIGTINLGVNGSSSSDLMTGNSFPSTQTLTLSAGSVTSVSAAGLTIPYGINLNGTSWIDPTGTDITLTGNGVAGVGVPAKMINLTAATVNDDAGSAIDLSGGGDLYAYRWVPGLGGSYDILNASYDVKGSLYDIGSKNAPSSSTSFAVIPGYQSDYAPFAPYGSSSNFSTLNPNPEDPTKNIIDSGYTSTGLVVGQQVHLGASNGLPAGNYTLLPARYALLPGAFLVTPQSGIPTGTVSHADGSSLVSGYTFNNLSPTRPLLSSFEVDPQSVVQARAEYDPSSANSFLSQSAQAQKLAIPRLPADAGQVVFNATQSLHIDGSLMAQPSAGGRGSLVDISSPADILIANQVGIANNPNFVGLTLDPTELSNFGADSLLIGGVRSMTTSGTTVNVATNKLVVDNTGNALTGPDVILVANKSLTLAANADVEQGTRTLTGPADALQVGQTKNLNNGDQFAVARGGVAISFPQGTPATDAQGNPSNDAIRADVTATVISADGKTTTNFAANTSFTVPVGGTVTLGGGGNLTVSGTVQVPVFYGDGTLLRVSSDPSASIVRAGVTGSTTPAMTIGSGAKISGGSVTLDSTGTTSLFTTNLSGSAINLDSGRISLQLGTSGSPQGLVLTSDALNALQNSAATLSSLSLLSYSSIDIYGSGQIGSPTLENLALHAGEIRGFNSNGGTVSFAAQNILLDNSANVTVTRSTGSPSGAIEFDATNAITLGANQLYIDQYAGVSLNASGGILVQGTGGLATQGALTMTTPWLTGATGANQKIAAGGTLSIGGSSTAAPANLGASLALQGTTVTDTSNIVLPSGTLTLRATGGDVTVGAGGVLDVSGTAQTIFGATQYTSGGQITLTSDTGNVSLATGSKVDVSAQPEAGNAGSLTISASNTTGTLINNGTLLGQGGAGGQGGTFSLDVGSLSGVGGNLDSLASVLSTKGFTHSISVRDRADPSVTLTGTLKAHTVNISADQGTIDIVGKIDASGDNPVANINTPPPNGVINWDGQTGGSINLAAFGDVKLEGMLNAEGAYYNDASQGGHISIAAGDYTTGSTVTNGYVSNSVNNVPVGAVNINGGTIDLKVDNQYTTSDLVAYWTSLTNGSPIGNPTNNTGSLPFGGTLLLSAPQTSGNDVQINPIPSGTINGASSVVVEGYKVYTPVGGMIDQTLETTIKTDGTSFATNNASAIASRLTVGNPSLNSVLHIQPGAEIVNPTGDLILASTWDLSNFRFGPNVTSTAGSGEPGILTLRAAGNLDFNFTSNTFASLSDGFGPTPTPTSTKGGLWQAPMLPAGSQSWSYNLVAGADLTAADFRQTKSGAGSVVLGSNQGSLAAPTTSGSDALTIEKYYQVIRTGTGDINIFAGQDVQLLNQLAAIYTAGGQAPVLNPASQGSFDSPNTSYVNSGTIIAPDSFANTASYYQAYYSQSGGSVTISAQGDIIHETTSGAQDSSKELPTNWLYRRGYVNPLTGQFDRTHAVSNLGIGPTRIGNNEVASTTWWVNFSNFFEGVGALGGGNVTLLAGHDVSNVDAVVPTNARVTKQLPNGDQIAADQTLFELGGGDLVVKAGHNINGGVYYVERGLGTLSAGNQILTNSTRSAASVASLNPTTWLPTTLFLGQGSFNITAVGSVLLGPVANPFLLPQGIDNSYFDKTYFSTYATTDAVKVSSLAGSVTLQDNPSSPRANSGSLIDWYANVLNQNSPGSSATKQSWLGLVETSVPTSAAYFPTAAALMPGTLQATAFSGDLNLVGNLTLSPSPNGTVDFAAAGSINGLQPNDFGLISQAAGNGVLWSASTIILSDANPANLPGLYNPLSLTASAVAATGSSPPVAATQDKYWANTPVTGTIVPNGPTSLLPNFATFFAESGSSTGSHGALQTQQALHGTSVITGTNRLGPLHANDATGPIQLYAGSGDISGLTLFAGKAAQVIAGSDITDTAFYIQNNQASDVSVVDAGRDIVAYDPNSSLRLAGTAAGNGLTNQSTTPEPGDIQINGPGTLEVLAGRNLNLGVGPNNADGTAVGITSVGNARNPALPFAGADVIAGAGIGSLATVATPGLDSGQLDFTKFNAQYPIPTSGDVEQQDIQALNNFYLVLRDAGHAFSDPASPTFKSKISYNPGFSAIADLFPGNAWQGDISLTSRDINTKNGGNISIFAPGGQLSVGLPVGGQATDQGILTQHGGDISIFTNKNVNVGVSRIFTLRGGNVIIWSSTGNIAAGSASKTVQSAPPTRVLVDPQSADIEPDLAGLATGGGIGVLATVPSVPIGNVSLIAPAGTVDAGDAGIRATGKVDIAATQVLNASNISAGGAISGTPAPPAAPNIGSIASASNSSSASSNAAAEVAKQGHSPIQQQEFPSIITVEVLGYGGGDS